MSDMEASLAERLVLLEEEFKKLSQGRIRVLEQKVEDLSAQLQKERAERRNLRDDVTIFSTRPQAPLLYQKVKEVFDGKAIPGHPAVPDLVKDLLRRSDPGSEAAQSLARLCRADPSAQPAPSQDGPAEGEEVQAAQEPVEPEEAVWTPSTVVGTILCGQLSEVQGWIHVLGAIPAGKWDPQASEADIIAAVAVLVAALGSDYLHHSLPLFDIVERAPHHVLYTLLLLAGATVTRHDGDGNNVFHALARRKVDVTDTEFEATVGIVGAAVAKDGGDVSTMNAERNATNDTPAQLLLPNVNRVSLLLRAQLVATTSKLLIH